MFALGIIARSDPARIAYRMVSIWLMRRPARFMSRNDGLRPTFDISIQDGADFSAAARARKQNAGW
jgi:hypothetical protein